MTENTRAWPETAGDVTESDKASVDVSVLTPVRNEERNLEHVVEAMRAQEFPGEVEFLFIDGRSTDRSREILERFAFEDSRIRVLENPAGHTTRALNIGLSAARGAFVARMDAHAVYPRHYLASAVRRLEAGGVDWVAGPQVPVGRDKWSRRVALALGTRLGTGGSGRWNGDLRPSEAGRGETELRTGVFTGVWRRETLARHGGWNEGWPINQDSELAARLLEAGARIVSLPQLAAEYTPRNSLRALARQYRRYGMYRARTFLHHPETLRWPQLAMPALVLAGGGSCCGPRALRRASRVGVGAYLSAVLVTSASAGRGRPADALALPLVFATMHTSWGAGFLLGLGRFARSAARARLGRRRLDRPGDARRADGRVALRVLVYVDYVYRREGGVVYAPRAFALFAAELRQHVDGLVFVGRLDPRPGASHYRLPADVEFVPLPHYESAARARGLGRALGGSLRSFGRALRSVDAAWVLGPQGLAIPFALLALARRRHLVLGIRQDLPRYARSRHPDRRALHLAADLLEGGFRLLARRVPITVVGPALAERYAGGRAVLPLRATLVRGRSLEPAIPDRNWDGPELRVLSVGRLEEEKNPLLLADVLVRLRAADRRWKLIVCGEGPLEDALRERLARLGVDKAADLRGYVHLEDGLDDLYRSAHAFLHVSWTEGLPQVVHEAGAARLPLVATAVGGIPDAVDGAAVLVPPGDADAAAAGVLRLASDEELRAGLVDRGLELARAHTLEAETERLSRFIAGTRHG